MSMDRDRVLFDVLHHPTISSMSSKKDSNTYLSTWIKGGQYSKARKMIEK
jgi:hypothetical protein